MAIFIRILLFKLEMFAIYVYPLVKYGEIVYLYLTERLLKCVGIAQLGMWLYWVTNFWGSSSMDTYH